ncbi:hypothetical protein TTHERM_000129629 (macronuclear) [Tetrahymena thermophila SB210]|uniref:Uncharacterized protein n=1 Tax=Tetrahymena thermophila (strain SB210) TaxID=312017 RepID=W7XCP8_TETTS|nr:hypothetical protein TTHERM_000129629 [Tetrahymena thermophila SB210]EWS74308.1 hypothetical protein TTHERM_000129629 [Tetrahymena thermophila SB210]|eukprot:XP_012653129.1 hypothetical protein TTHERM_000129629 [Tetrahymena thermophila SB210]
MLFTFKCFYQFNQYLYFNDRKNLIWYENKRLVSIKDQSQLKSKQSEIKTSDERNRKYLYFNNRKNLIWFGLYSGQDYLITLSQSNYQSMRVICTIQMEQNYKFIKSQSKFKQRNIYSIQLIPQRPYFISLIKDNFLPDQLINQQVPNIDEWIQVFENFLSNINYQKYEKNINDEFVKLSGITSPSINKATSMRILGILMKVKKGNVRDQMIEIAQLFSQTIN